MKKLMLMLVLFNLVAAPAFAGEAMKKGTVLQEDSYVFSIEEAHALQEDIQSLEQEIQKQQDLVEEYKKLDLVHQTKEGEFDKIIASKEEQKQMYRELYILADERVQKLEKKKTWEKVGLVVGSVVVTTGLIFAADAIDDHIDRTGAAGIRF
jgi:hypothetical protein